MPEYTLRAVDPHIWSLFTERAGREGWPTKALLVNLMDAYGRGDITVGTPPPKQLPQWAWLRAHYREIARADSFHHLDVNDQWEALVEHVLDSPAGLSWRELNGVPPAYRAEILRWLRETSNLSPREVLTLRAIAHVGEGSDLQTNRRAFQYEVLGLQGHQQAWIADFGGGWRILRALDGKTGEWGEPHLTKKDALDTLARAQDEQTT
jgi:hypothetical protein